MFIFLENFVRLNEDTNFKFREGLLQVENSSLNIK